MAFRVRGWKQSLFVHRHVHRQLSGVCSVLGLSRLAGWLGSVRFFASAIGSVVAVASVSDFGVPRLFCFEKPLSRRFCGARKEEKSLSLLGLPAGKLYCPAPGKKRNRVQSGGFKRGFSEWTLKGVFRFFPSTSVGIPKSFRGFLLFPRQRLGEFIGGERKTLKASLPKCGGYSKILAKHAPYSFTPQQSTCRIRGCFFE